jgi:hypothetical protein
MSDSEVEVEKPKKVDRRVGRKPTEAQLEGLRKGMAVIKEKREKLAKEREEHEEKKAKGEVPEDAPAPKYTPKPKIKPITVKPREVVEVPRKRPEKNVTHADLEALKSSLLSAVTPQKVEVPVEKIVHKEVPVEKIVHKDRVISGSDLLNAVFFSNK